MVIQGEQGKAGKVCFSADAGNGSLWLLMVMLGGYGQAGKVRFSADAGNGSLCHLWRGNAQGRAGRVGVPADAGNGHPWLPMKMQGRHGIQARRARQGIAGQGKQSRQETNSA